MGADSGGRVDIVVDNAGYELVSDMLLGYILLKTGMCVLRYCSLLYIFYS